MGPAGPLRDAFEMIRKHTPKPAFSDCGLVRSTSAFWCPLDRVFEHERIESSWAVSVRHSETALGLQGCRLREARADGQSVAFEMIRKHPAETAFSDRGFVRPASAFWGPQDHSATRLK